MTTQIAILGSTGSIGTQTVDIIRRNPHLFSAHTLTAGRNYKLLIEQALELHPRRVVIAASEYYNEVKVALQHTETEVCAGIDAIEEAVGDEDIDVVITAMVGISGLRPTIAALKKGKTIGLANKETLVVAGELIMRLASETGARIIPVDSEHSAIYQCLIGETTKAEKIILTASGGPFRTLSKEELLHVTKSQALRHPNWVMGAKVTIDSASLMNKGLEMIEARWLFDTPPSDIEVLVHPQSIIHSMVQFADGSIKAQLGIPDMRLPISYALGLTERVANDLPRYNFLSQGFTFERPNLDHFPNLSLAYQAIHSGGDIPAVMNAANEIAVAAFLQERIGFCQMSTLISTVMSRYSPTLSPSLEHLLEVDLEVRAMATSLL